MASIIGDPSRSSPRLALAPERAVLALPSRVAQKIPWPGLASGGGLDGDAVPLPFERLECAAAGSFSVPAVVVVGPGLAVFDASLPTLVRMASPSARKLYSDSAILTRSCPWTSTTLQDTLEGLVGVRDVERRAPLGAEDPGRHRGPPATQGLGLSLDLEAKQRPRELLAHVHRPAVPALGRVQAPTREPARDPEARGAGAAPGGAAPAARAGAQAPADPRGAVPDPAVGAVRTNCPMPTRVDLDFAAAWSSPRSRATTKGILDGGLVVHREPAPVRVDRELNARVAELALHVGEALALLEQK